MYFRHKFVTRPTWLDRQMHQLRKTTYSQNKGSPPLILPTKTDSPHQDWFTPPPARLHREWEPSTTGHQVQQNSFPGDKRWQVTDINTGWHMETMGWCRQWRDHHQNHILDRKCHPENRPLYKPSQKLYHFDWLQKNSIRGLEFVNANVIWTQTERHAEWRELD